MIQATELRPGNYIKLGGNTLETYQTYKPIQVNPFTIQEILEENEERPDAILSVFQPIKLTPEILEQCGFELFPWGWVKKSTKDFGVRLKVQSFNYEVSGNNPVELNYIHQLQNLYHALTGEELQVNISQLLTN